MVWNTAHGVRGVVWPLPAAGKCARALGPDHGNLWRRSLRHRQTGRPVENNALWALPLPPASDFPGLEAEAVKLSAFAVNPHRTGLWHKAGPAANALGHDGTGPEKSFGALGAHPPQRRQDGSTIGGVTQVRGCCDALRFSTGVAPARASYCPFLEAGERSLSRSCP